MKGLSFFLSFLRGFTYLSVLFFAGMLYWSSLLLEDKLTMVDDKLTNLSQDLKNDRERIVIGANPKPFSSKRKTPLDASLPNLLKEDPFYQKTLPSLLGEGFSPKGTLKSAVFGKPINLHPFSQWSDVAAWNTLCVPSLSTLMFGIYETMAPDLAVKIEKREDPNQQFVDYFVYLREGVFWEPLDPKMFPSNIKLSPHFLKRHPVTAHDFKFYFDAIMNPYVEEQGAISQRIFLQGLLDVKVIDDTTFVVRWEMKDKKLKYVANLRTGSLKPLPCFVYQYYPDGKKIVEEDTNENTYRTHAAFGQIFSNHFAKNVIVSCGPWIFEGMTDRMISFRKNPNYWNPYAVLVKRFEISFKTTPEAIWQDFKAGLIDFCTLQPAQKLDMDQFLTSAPYEQQKQNGRGIEKLEYLNRAYYYIGWNFTKPYFKSKKVRQALAMAVDKQRLIRQNLFGMGLEVSGTFYRFSAAYDPSITPWPYDPFQAKRLLESEGWYDHNGDGILDKEIDGKLVPFRFTLTYYVKNPTTKSICDFVSTALKEIGIDCQLNGVDIADLSKVFDDKSFDAYALGWALESPPEDPKQLWDSSLAKQQGSSNAIGFENPEVDKIIEALEYTSDPQERITLYHKFDRILHEEAPYLFLYSPKSLLLYRSYVKNIFIPADRQDLIPGANIKEPDTSIAVIK